MIPSFEICSFSPSNFFTLSFISRFLSALITVGSLAISLAFRRSSLMISTGFFLIIPSFYVSSSFILFLLAKLGDLCFTTELLYEASGFIFSATTSRVYTGCSLASSNYLMNSSSSISPLLLISNDLTICFSSAKLISSSGNRFLSDSLNSSRVQTPFWFLSAFKKATFGEIPVFSNSLSSFLIQLDGFEGSSFPFIFCNSGNAVFSPSCYLV